MKILLGITGASYAKISLRLIEILSQKCELYAIFSQNAKIVLKNENGINFSDLKFQNCKIFDDCDISASVASGSFGIEKTIIAPCSINTLAKISAGICDTLITRSAAVALKERKTLILSPREMPFSPISLKQMSELANLGVLIAPPVIASYSKVQNLAEMENFIIGKWLDLLGIENQIYKRWQK